MKNCLINNEKAHDQIAQVYDRKHTEIYNDVEQLRLQEIIKEILSLFNNRKNIKVLDFGAGTGNLTLKFLKYNCNVTALDISSKELKVLEKKVKKKNKLKTKVFNGKMIPFDDNSFDLVATYSVLHHIPDYLSAVKEMIRVTKKGGFIYIDHEANEKKWENKNNELKEYYKQTKHTLFDHSIKLLKTKELFTYDLIKTIFIKLFINKRYQREGDIHVWSDDHIDWNKIYKVIKETNCSIIKEKDYLLYRTKGSIKLYKKYKNICADTKYIFIKKLK